MTTDQITGTVTGSVEIATGGNYADPLTVGATGVVTGTVFVDNGETVINYGRLNTTGYAYGVSFATGGAITNEAGATISGGSSAPGAAIAGADGTTTVDNFGTVSGDRGIAFSSDGAITNEAGGVIIGASNGVLAATGTLFNDGSISAGGSSYKAVGFSNGGSVTNDADGTINGSGEGVDITGATGTVVNSGTIIGTQFSGVYLGMGGSVGNSGTIASVNFGTGAGDAVDIEGAAGTVDNSGTIYVMNGLSATASSDFGAGVLLEAGGTVTNEAGAQIIGGGKGVYLKNGGGSVINLTGGTIQGYQFGVKVFGAAAGTVDNQGLIEAGTLANGYGVYLGTGGGTVTNEIHGTIIGENGIGAAESGGGPITIFNQGTIAGHLAGIVANSGAVYNQGVITGSPTVSNSAGINFQGSGTIDNEAGGTISGHVIGINAVDNLSLTNASGATISSYEYAVNVNGTGTIDNSGAILAGTFANSQGVYLNVGGSVINRSGGTISGDRDGVYVKSGDSTIDNTGTIAGGFSVYFNGTGDNTVIVHAGAVFDGDVFANAGGTNTLELASGAAGGAITGLGDNYQNFQTVTIDSGASWDIGGSEAGFSASSIVGFHAGDRLDIADLPFNPLDTATVSSGVLNIYNHAGMVLDSIDLPGDFSGQTFNLLSDGNGDTFVEEDGVACYCRGTLILTTKGERAVQDLRIGDLLVTASGAARPIRWIGTRTYDGRFLAGRKDILPVTIAAGALGDNVPKRDLSVSPLHAMFIDGVLIPANALIDDISIIQADAVRSVAYFHIELDTHDVIVAEGALSETFVDDGSRGIFHNAAEFARLYPKARRKPVDYCAPIVEDGEALETVRRRIAARSPRVRKAA